MRREVGIVLVVIYPLSGELVISYCTTCVCEGKQTIVRYPAVLETIRTIRRACSARCRGTVFF